MRKFFSLRSLTILALGLFGCEASTNSEPAPTTIISEKQPAPEPALETQSEIVTVPRVDEPEDLSGTNEAGEVVDESSETDVDNQPQDMKKLIDHFLFYPKKFPIGNWEPRNLQRDDVWFDTVDGSKLHAWYCPLPNAQATLFYAHGNGGNLSHRADRIRELQQRLTCNVFIYDYRGYGQSEGVPTATGIIEDSEAALTWLLAKTGLEAREIIFLGRSLGGAVAADLAHRHGGKALILESAFSSLREISAFYTSPILSKILVADQLNTARILAEIDCPVVISHGTIDHVVPYSHGVRLSKLAPEPHLFVELPSLDHNDRLPEWYYDQMVEFLTNQFSKPKKTGE